MKNKDFIIELLSADNVSSAIRKNTDALLSVIPELKNTVGFEHCHPHHHLNVWEHTLLALSLSENQLEIRIALLLHDVAKPLCYQQDGTVRHYRGHAESSSVIAKTVLERLGFDADFVERVCRVIRLHDTPLTREDIVSLPALSQLIFAVQKCDALAHNPEYNQKRLKYITETQKIIDELNF